MSQNPKASSIVLAFAFGALLIGCTSDSSGPAEDRSEAAAETRAMHEQARAEIKDQLDDLERRLTALRQEADQAGDKVEGAWNESVADLERRTAELRREWESMENQSEAAWDAFSERARRAIDEIESGLREAADELG